MAIVELYANFDLETGDDDGTTEANAFQTWDSAILEADSILSGGDSVHLYVKRTTSRDYYDDYITWATSTSETEFLTIEGYETTPGDNGIYEVELAQYTSVGITGSSIQILNIDIYGDSASWLWQNHGANSSKVNCGAYNISGTGGGFSITDSELVNCRAVCAGTCISLYRSKAIGCYAERTTSGEAIQVRTDYRYNIVFGCTIIQTTVDKASGAAGIGVEGGTTTSYSTKIMFNTIRGFQYGIRYEAMRQNGDASHNVTGNIISDCGTGIENVDVASRTLSLKIFENAFYNCDTDINASYSLNMYSTSLTSSPFTDVGSKDFSLNDVSDGGALAKGKYPFAAGTKGEVLSLGAYQ